MNQTQTLIIAATFGAILSLPSATSIFLEQIMPIILRTASSEVLLPITILYFAIFLLIFIGSLAVYGKIIQNINLTHNNHPAKFDKFMIKNVITFIISFFLALIIRIRFF